VRGVGPAPPCPALPCVLVPAAAPLTPPAVPPLPPPPKNSDAEGTIDAAVFLAGRVAAGAAPRPYTMIDVLRSGAM